MTGAAFFAILMLLFGIGLYVAVSMGLGAFALAAVFSDKSIVGAYGYIPWNTVTAVTFVALPLFILMGELLLRSGTSSGMYNALSKWFGPLPGGLLHTNVAACALFSCVSGSSAATAATVGRVSLPFMKKYDYPERMALGSLAAAGTLGILIPPSITFIVYGIMTEQSVGRLYLAAMVPGLLMTAAYMALIFIDAKLKPQAAVSLPRAGWREKAASLVALLPITVIMLIVLGTIYLGIATASEAAAFGVTAAFVLAWMNRKVSRAMLRETFLATAGTTAMIMFILLGAFILQFVLALLGVPAALTQWVAGLGLGPVTIVLAICAFYLVLGTFMEEISMVIMTIPVFLPMLKSLGVDLVWFGVVVVILVCASIISPPVGVNLFVLQNLRKQIAPKGQEPPIKDVFIGVLPFFAVTIIVLLIVVAFPQLSLWLPDAAAAK
jgi:tripartite ATP-independent transporter DctM subunit